MTSQNNIVCLIIIAGIIFICCDTTSAWGRRRRRSCTSHSCTWHWGGCSRTCGGGQQSPIKTRTQGSCGSCSMPSRPRSCNGQCCPVNCNWNGWGSWGSCSRSCEGGTQSRSRSKRAASCGGSGCPGSSAETRPCNRQCCPVHCSWASWSDWGSCSVSCGGGRRSRGRGYSKLASCGGSSCTGSSNENQGCNSQCCPVNCAWEAWSTWGSCPVSCGGGIQSRNRGQSLIMSCGGKQCVGEPNESRSCNQNCCPVNCEFEKWGAWSVCTKSCGSGTQSRTRGISVSSYCGGRACMGAKIESQLCNKQCCPVDCKWNLWESWSQCTKTCEKGTQFRGRQILIERSCGGSECGGIKKDTRPCNDVCCPVHCQWEGWNAWGRCTKTCGGGTQDRHREVNINAVCNGEECQGLTDETQACNSMCCPVNCILSKWELWTECSTTCGAGGLQQRHRSVIQPSECGGRSCDPTLHEDRACNRICFNGGSIDEGTCHCDVGWRGDCCEQDVNECEIINCVANSLCINTDGSYICACNHGYSRKGKMCEDIDECHLEMHDCHQEAQCINREGHYICQCNPGFSGSGTFCNDIDECILEDSEPDAPGTTSKMSNIRSPLCHDVATCTNTYGSYKCQCNLGYTGDGFTCTDVNECFLFDKLQTDGVLHDTRSNVTINQSLADCDNNATCINVIGGYDCMCKNGYYGSGFLCHDINECNSNPCQNEAVCQNLVNSFQCQCRDGYTGITCETDINECYSIPCRNEGVCQDLINSFQCQCQDGYTGKMCETDIDECASVPCQHGGSCFDQVDSFYCQCVEGYTGMYCDVDIDECASVPCQYGGSCFDEVNSFYCQCNEGYTGMVCDIDIDECTSVPCQHGGSCFDQVDSFYCQCRGGYTGTICELDIDECHLESHDCHQEALCVNIDGDYMCQCNEGFTGDGVTCMDINECWSDFTEASGDHDETSLESSTEDLLCDKMAACINNYGSYVCVCNQGYTGDGVICTDINECEYLEMADDISSSGSGEGDASGSGKENQLSRCHNNSTCMNNDGSYGCVCDRGYHGNGFICEDINECNLMAHDCDREYGLCINTIGTYSCSCKSGFSGDGKYCSDINECATMTHECNLEHGLCSNAIGTYSCSCINGFSGDGMTCADIHECDSEIHDCSDNGICTNLLGSHACQCKSGYSGDGRTCVDIDECSADLHTCHGLYQICKNTDGGYECECKELLEMKDGECKEREPSKFHTQTSSDQSKLFLQPSILIILALTAVLLVAGIFLCIKVTARSYKPMSVPPNMSEGTFTTRSEELDETNH